MGVPDRFAVLTFCREHMLQGMIVPKRRFSSTALIAARAPTISRCRARVATFVGSDQAGLTPTAGGADGVVGHILGIVFTAMANGMWVRLKACRNPACQWAFYDTSKNRGGVWCTMEVCGSRHKARTYRQRQRAEE